MPDFVVNTSPLQYLHQLGPLHILPHLADQVVVPQAVVRVPAVAPLLDRLKELRFHVDDATCEAVLSRAGEAAT